MSKRPPSPIPSTSQPPSKRPASSQDLPAPQRSLTFDFPDGNIELVIGEKRIYRIHKSVLGRASSVFRDMMEIARDLQVDGTEGQEDSGGVGKAKKVGEGEVLDLKEDKVVEWELLLSLVYNGSKFLPSSLPLHKLRSLLHLSRKYSFDDLYSTASTLVLDRFIFEENFILYHKAPYPVSIYQDPLYYQGETPDPVHPSRSLRLLIGFLTLVREFNLEEKKKGVIGRVFYCIVLRYSPDFDGLTRVTGGKATDGWKTSLDANDVFTLLRLQSFLLDEQSRLLNEKACPRIFKKHYACRGNADCEEAALLGWKDQFQNYYDDEEDRLTAYGPGEEGTNVYIKHWLKKIAEWDGWGDGEEDVEDGCVQEIYHYWNQRRYNFEKQIYSICGLPIETEWRPKDEDDEDDQ